MTLDEGERARLAEEVAHLTRFVADCRRALESGPDPHLSAMIERGEARLEVLARAGARSVPPADRP